MKNKSKSVLLILVILAIAILAWVFSKPSEVGSASVSAVHVDMDNEDEAISGAIIRGADDIENTNSLPARMAEANVVLFDDNTVKIDYKVVLGYESIFSSKAVVTFYDENHNLVDTVEFETEDEKPSTVQELKKNVNLKAKAHEVTLDVEVKDALGTYKLESVNGAQVFQ